MTFFVFVIIFLIIAPYQGHSLKHRHTVKDIYDDIDINRGKAIVQEKTNMVSLHSRSVYASYASMVCCK